jgi:hypothetical protein
MEIGESAGQLMNPSNNQENAILSSSKNALVGDLVRLTSSRRIRNPILNSTKHQCLIFRAFAKAGERDCGRDVARIQVPYPEI